MRYDASARAIHGKVFMRLPPQSRSDVSGQRCHQTSTKRFERRDMKLTNWTTVVVALVASVEMVTSMPFDQKPFMKDPILVQVFGMSKCPDFVYTVSVFSQVCKSNPEIEASHSFQYRKSTT